MRLYEVEFSFEIDEEHGSCFATFPTLKEAKEFTVAQLHSEQEDRKDDESPRTLTATISEVRTVTLTSSVLCYIINTQGGGWKEADSDRLLLSYTLEPNKKRHTVVKHK